MGGYPDFWIDSEPMVARIDAVNPDAQDWNVDAYPRHNISLRIGDGRKLGLSEGEYDIGFSNSVLEHVGSWEDLVAFAREIARVGRRVWVQTPARECWIEPHYLAPFVHWLPRSWQRRILRWATPWGWLAKPSRELVDEMVETTRLLTRREMEQLFPDCEILVEPLFPGVPKSYIAVRKSF